MATVNFYNCFDVWGNEKDGWEVNDQCLEFNAVELPNLDDATLIAFLKERNFLTAKANRKNIRIEEVGNYLDVCEKKSGKPLGYFAVLDWEE